MTPLRMMRTHDRRRLREAAEHRVAEFQRGQRFARAGANSLRRRSARLIAISATICLLAARARMVAAPGNATTFAPPRERKGRAEEGA